MDEPYVTIEELAKHFSMSVHTIRKRMRDGDVPNLQIGRVYRFRISEFEAYLRSSTRSSNRKSKPESEVPQLKLSSVFNIDDPNEDI